MIIEIWRNIKGYENLYQVSNFGRVRSLSIKHSRRQKIQLKKLNHDCKGYLRIPLCKDGVTKTHKVHRLVAFAFIPQIKDKNLVNHKDTVKDNNFVLNLEWMTDGENYHHAIEQGARKPLKPNSPLRKQFAKLNEKSVIEIREELKNGVSMSELAIKHNVHYNTIERVKARRTWKHVA